MRSHAKIAGLVVATLCADVPVLGQPGVVAEAGWSPLASGSTLTLDQPADSPADAPSEVATRPERPWTVSISGGGSYTFAADIDDSDGDVRIARAMFGVGVGIPVGERSRLSFSIEEEASWYLFDNATGLVPGSTDPFELGLSTDFSVRFFAPIDEDWSWFVGGNVNVSGEPDVDVGDAVTFGGLAGARYRVNERLALSFGVAGRSRLEDSALFIPLLGVEWKVSDRVTLSTEGTGLRVAAKLDEAFTVALSGGWESREYRLRDDGPLPDGVARDARVPIAVSLDYAPSRTFRLSVFAGAVVWQEFQFDDRDGDEISETNTDPAPFVGISGTFSF